MAITTPIPHGDCVFFGVWEDEQGEPVNIRVCVERKKIGDMANSIHTGRYLAQAQRAREAGFEKLILIVEGPVRIGGDGLVTIPKMRARKRVWVPVVPHIQYSRFDRYLSELDLYTGITVKRSGTVRETASMIKALWLLFQKPPKDHDSLHQIYTEATPQGSLLSPPSLLRKIAKELPGIGWGRSRAVDQHFGSIVAMMVAEVDDWVAIEGIGKKTAELVVTAIQARRK